MKEVKELLGKGIYLICAESAANTHLIENKRELQILLNMFRNRLAHYLKIFDYSITPTGWHLVVKMDSHSSIMKCYQARESQKKKKGKRVCTSVDEVMSETVRLLRSHFTNKTNILRGRKGNASKEVFKKYTFTSLKEAQRYIENLRSSKINMEQPLQRYRANRSNYDEDGQISKSAKLLSSEAFHEGNHRIYGLFATCIKDFDYLGKWFMNCISFNCILHGYEVEDLVL